MRKVVFVARVVALFLAIVAAGCGGGDSPGGSLAMSPDAAVSALRSRMATAQAATAQDAAQQVMDFGEVQFPQYFPVRQANSSTGPFLYRYYADTGVYLGVVVVDTPGYQYRGVYVMGGPFGNNPYYVGPLSNFITPTTAGLSISGTASRHGAMNGATINATCQTGTATTTTDSSGNYSLTVPEGVQPCVLSATSATSGSTIYSASVSGNTANITALTHLVVAGVLGKDPGTAGTLTQSATFAALTAGNITNSLARLVAALQPLGITVPASTNPITAPLVAGTSEGPGDSMDQAGVQLVASLAAANVKLSSYAGTIATATSTSDATSKSSALAASAGIPTSRLSGCPFAVTGKYWLAESNNGAATGGGNNLSELQMNFSSMTAVYKSNAAGFTQSFTITRETDSSGTVPCGVVITSGAKQHTVRVSSGGVAAVGAAMGSSGVAVSTTDVGVAVYQSPLTLADLQGTWYLSSYDLGEDNKLSPTWGKIWTTGFSQLDVAASGSFTQSNCQGAAPAGATTSAFVCGGSGSGSGTITAGASPGLFRLTGSNGDAANIAVFRAANGDMAMLFQLAAQTDFAVRSMGVGAKRSSSYTIRPVGASWQNGNWTLSNTNTTATNPGAQQRARDQTYTVTATNGSSVTRQDASQPPVVDTVVYDAPYEHMAWRPATATAQEWVGIGGSGWSVVGTTNQSGTGFWNVSIQRY